MGVHCEISLFKPMDGIYKPGTIVSGSIKFAVDKVTEFSKITVSLKGFSLLRIEERRSQHSVHHRAGNQRHTITHVNKEVIVDNDTVVKSEKFTMNIGSEEMRFHFKLPLNIPPTFKYSKHQGRERIYCKIFYYIRIKFDRPGLFERTKRFKKEMAVESGVLPVLPRGPAICAEKKTLTTIFSSKNHIVNLKAVIQDSVIEIGGKIDFNCEVENLTNINIKALEIRLLEVYTFMKNNYTKTKVTEYVKHTDSKTSSIKTGEKQTFDFVIDVPSDKVSVEHSQIIFRKYFVEILARLPIPHRNFPLTIPLQIGHILDSEMHLVPTLVASDVNVEAGGASSFEEPPTYWEAMGEEKADVFDNLDEISEN